MKSRKHPKVILIGEKLKTLFILATLYLFHGALLSADITTNGTDSINLEKFRERTIYVEFESSQKMTAELRQRFEVLGFNLSDSPDKADISVKVLSLFSFQQTRGKQQQIDFGKVIEADSGEVLEKKASQALREPGVNLTPLVHGLRGDLGLGMVFGLGLVDKALKLSGAKGWLNKMLVGDERGICLGTAEMCKDWKKFDQSMRIAAVITPATANTRERIIVRAEAKAKDEKLLPEELFREAMRELTGRLLSQPDTAQKPVTAEQGETIKKDEMEAKND